MLVLAVWVHLNSQRRALGLWRGYASDRAHRAALEQQLTGDLARSLAARTLRSWRHMLLARAALRRLYLRRALVGWFMRVQVRTRGGQCAVGR